jgi:hypothetical protein
MKRPGLLVDHRTEREALPDSRREAQPFLEILFSDDPLRLIAFNAPITSKLFITIKAVGRGGSNNIKVIEALVRSAASRTVENV